MLIADLDWKTLIIAFLICVVFIALLSFVLSRRRRTNGPREKDLVAINPDKLDAVWCLVGQVTPLDEEQQPPEAGRLAPGTKVYCLPWKKTRKGKERIEVMGHPSDSPKMIVQVMTPAELTDLRLERVYQPGVLQRLAASNKASRGDPNLWGDETDAQAALDSLLGEQTEDSTRR